MGPGVQPITPGAMRSKKRVYHRSEKASSRRLNRSKLSCRENGTGQPAVSMAFLSSAVLSTTPAILQTGDFPACKKGRGNTNGDRRSPGMTGFPDKIHVSTFSFDER